MDITLFLFFSFLVVVLLFFAFLFRSYVGMGLGWLAGILAILIGIKVGSGELITVIENGTVFELQLGLDPSDIAIIYILLGIAALVASSWDWIDGR